MCELRISLKLLQLRMRKIKMNDAVGVLMSKYKGGRPPKDAGNQGTKSVRMIVDLAEMISDIADVKGISTAVFLDPLLRPEIEEMYAQYELKIKKMKDLRDEQEEIRRQASEEPPTKKRPK